MTNKHVRPRLLSDSSWLGDSPTSVVAYDVGTRNVCDSHLVCILSQFYQFVAQLDHKGIINLADGSDHRLRSHPSKTGIPSPFLSHHINVSVGVKDVFDAKLN